MGLRKVDTSWIKINTIECLKIDKIYFVSATAQYLLNLNLVISQGDANTFLSQIAKLGSGNSQGV